MARPIEATPVLRGKEAVDFIKAIQHPQPFTPPEIDLEKLHAAVKRIAEERAKKQSLR
jgi:hypothetical protein